MYSGCVGVRCGVRFERSALKLDEVLGIVWEGTSDSFSIVTRRPRLEGEDWSVLKASMSSLEAGRGSVSRDDAERLAELEVPDIPDCMLYDVCVCVFAEDFCVFYKCRNCCLLACKIVVAVSLHTVPAMSHCLELITAYKKNCHASDPL
jgi:hypothetical protein